MAHAPMFALQMPATVFLCFGVFFVLIQCNWLRYSLNQE